MLADDPVGRQALHRRHPAFPVGAVNRMLEVAEVADLAVPHAPCPLHLFGWPVQVCNAPDSEGRQLGGPQASPAEWLWGVYAGPSTARRRQALGLLDTADLAAWR